MKPLSILVADDEEGIRGLLEQWLQRAGHRVTSAGDGNEATRLLPGKTFDLLITDVVMPNGDGLELIAAFKKAFPDGAILAMSGGGRYLQGNDCLKIARGLGAHATLTKPFTGEQLLATIGIVLGKNTFTG